MGKHVELFSCYIILKAVMTQTDWNRSTFSLSFFILFFFADVCTEFYEIFKIGRICYKEQLVTFGGSSGAPSHNYSGFFKVCEQHLRE